MDAILSAMTELLVQSKPVGYLTLPIDALVEITSALDTMDKVCTCTPDIFVDFLSAYIDFIAEFFNETQRVQRHLPSADYQISVIKGLPAGLISHALENTPIPSNMCFTMMLTPALLKKRSKQLDKRLNETEKPGFSNSKSSKNITFVKQPDILENAMRDGEVSVADMFVQAAYSMMRLAVRYVSQYRPQILKTLLQKQMKAVKRAIDTLFMFVSSTKNVEEVSKDRYDGILKF